MTRRLATATIAVVALVVACTGGPATPTVTVRPSPPASAAANPGHPPEPTRVPTASPALPASLEPGTAPTSDVLLLRVERHTGMGSPGVLLELYADGSLIEPRRETDGRATIRRLADAGIEALVGPARDSGLFTSSRTIEPARSPEPGGIDGVTVTLHAEGRRATVTTAAIWPTAEGQRLLALADTLVATPGALPPDSFVDGDARPHPFDAADVRLLVHLVSLPEGDWILPSVGLGRVSWPLDRPILDIGQVQPYPSEAGRTARCAILGGPDALRVQAALVASGAAATWGADQGERAGSAWDLATAIPRGLVRITLQPFLPDETPACDAFPSGYGPELQAPGAGTLADLLLAAGEGPIVDGEIAAAIRVEPAMGMPFSTTYLADGSVVGFFESPSVVGLGVRQLTPAGVEMIRGIAADLVRLVDAGLPPPGRVELVSTYTVGPLTEDQARFETTPTDPTGRSAIDLAETLAHPGERLLASAWADDGTARPYRPSQVRITIATADGEPDPTLPLVHAWAVAWPLGRTIETFGEPSNSGNAADRCAIVDADAAARVVKALVAAGLAAPVRNDPEYRSATWELAGRTPGTVVSLSLEIPLPGVEFGSC